jgi:C4-dicarboxylate transporter, DctM subunit
VVEPVVAIVAALLLLFALVIVRVPVAFSLLAAGAAGILLLEGADLASASMARLPYQSVSSFALIIVPLFIFMGMLAKNGRMAEDAFLFAARAFRRVPGGLAIASIAACASFAAVSGSSVATVASVGRVAIGEMIRHGYDRCLAAGVIGAAGTLGVLIPPSVVLVIYGIITGESVGALLLAGFLPGLLSAGLYVVYIIWRGIRDPEAVALRSPSAEILSSSSGQASPDIAMEASAGDRGTSGSASAARSLADSEASHKATQDEAEKAPVRIVGLAQITVLFLIVMGGIYAGVFTPIESAAIGAFAAFIIVLFDHVRLPGGMRAGYDNARTALGETVSITAMALALIIGGSVFTLFLVLARVPQNLSAWAVGLNVPAVLIVVVLLLLFIPMGMFLDSLSILLIAVPLAYPVVTELGYSGIWFGILVVKMIEIGMITPPLGLNVFVVAGTTDEVDVSDVFRGIAPFFVVDLITVAILFAFPIVVLFVPETMR